MIMNVFQSDTEQEPLMSVDTRATATVGVVKMFYSPTADPAYSWRGEAENRFVAAQIAHNQTDSEGCGLIVILKPKYETPQPTDSVCCPGDDCCPNCCPNTGEHNAH